ncbi:hypothetical protein T439DRAFT_322403 [Meredithblackwellia eburnea MCA 4105]
MPFNRMAARPLQLGQLPPPVNYPLYSPPNGSSEVVQNCPHATQPPPRPHAQYAPYMSSAQDHDRQMPIASTSAASNSTSLTAESGAPPSPISPPSASGYLHQPSSYPMHHYPAYGYQPQHQPLPHHPHHSHSHSISQSSSSSNSPAIPSQPQHHHQQQQEIVYGGGASQPSAAQRSTSPPQVLRQYYDPRGPAAITAASLQQQNSHNPYAYYNHPGGGGGPIGGAPPLRLPLPLPLPSPLSYERPMGLHERMPSYERPLRYEPYPHLTGGSGAPSGGTSTAASSVGGSSAGETATSWAEARRAAAEAGSSGLLTPGSQSTSNGTPGLYDHQGRDGYFSPRAYEMWSLANGVGVGSQGPMEGGPRAQSPRGSDGSHDSFDSDRTESTTLAHLLNQADYAPFIRWNADGTAFIFAHGSTELLEIFSRFFRHSNCHSFVRQLNIYGFTRLTTLDLLAAVESTPHPQSPASGEFAAFAHPLFFRGPTCRLGLLKPKAVKTKKVPSVKSGMEDSPRSSSTTLKSEYGGKVQSSTMAALRREM